MMNVSFLLSALTALLLLTAGYTVPALLSGKPDVSPSNGLPDRPDMTVALLLKNHEGE